MHTDPRHPRPSDTVPDRTAAETRQASPAYTGPSPATFRLGLVQSGFPADGDVIAQVRSFCHAAKEQACDIVAFPENLMCPRDLTADELQRLSEPICGPFIKEMARISKESNLWLVGTMSERREDGGAPYNTAFVLSPEGTLEGTYRKCHLYDAHGVRESVRMSAGDSMGRVVQTPFCTLGLAICYDLRFPEMARSLALQGAELILYPAAWHNGPHKENHWKTLLAARAIENEVFVAGICHAGTRYVGRSLVADPLGTILCEGPEATEEALVVCDLDRGAIASARDAMPIMEHRRPELYGSLVSV